MGLKRTLANKFPSLRNYTDALPEQRVRASRPCSYAPFKPFFSQAPSPGSSIRRGSLPVMRIRTSLLRNYNRVCNSVPRSYPDPMIAR